MKKALILLTILFLNVANGEGLSEESKVLQTVPMGASFAVILEDNSIWELFAFKLRPQTWSEWLHREKPNVAKNYVWTSDEWQISDDIQIETNDFDKLMASNFDEISRGNFQNFSYILTNFSSDKIAFAKSITLEKLIDMLLDYSDEMYRRGSRDMMESLPSVYE